MGRAYFLLFAIGLLIFFTIAFTFSFKEKVFQAFFQKPFSLAIEEDSSPKVNLIAAFGNIFKRGAVNVENGKSNIILRWTAENAKVCLGRFWSNVASGSGWVGSKDAKGGEWEITDALATGIYIYSINCSNESGDSFGSSVTVNVGAKPSNLQPHITSFQAFEGDNKFDLNKLNQINLDSNLKITWSTINTETPYGVCVANGSWPTIYKNTANLTIKESFVLDRAKIYKYSILCSNENGYDSQEISFIVR